MTKIAINGSATSVVEVLKAMEDVFSHYEHHGERDFVLSVKIENEQTWKFDSHVSECLTSLYNS